MEQPDSHKAHGNEVALYLAQEGTGVSQVLGAARRTPDAFALIAAEDVFTDTRDEEIRSVFKEVRALNVDRRLVCASKDERVCTIAEEEGWNTMISSAKQLRLELDGHPEAATALRTFSPQSWSQDIRSKLQSAGILALPRNRIWLLFFVSIAVFLFVFFRLLPSATIIITPSQNTESFTTNVYLVASGATSLPVDPERVRTLPLLLITVPAERTVTYDQISTNFTGTNARMTVRVFNDSDETYSLRGETRIVNQAGMIFRLQEPVILAAGETVDVIAEADPLDQYGEVIGERGNVPVDVKWDFVGLTPAERKFVYARNITPGTGGVTSYETILRREDLEGTNKVAGARQRLEQELLSIAKQQAEDERLSLNKLKGTDFVQLQYEELTRVEYGEFDLSEEFVGQAIATVPVSGSVEYTIILYDQKELLELLVEEARQRTPETTILSEESISIDNIDLHVIAPWDDNLQWVKITADLSYNQRYDFDPLTPTGAALGKHIRENVVGKTVDEAYRVLRNLPEVSSVEISVWPPWSRRLPAIGTNVAIREKL